MQIEKLNLKFKSLIPISDVKKIVIHHPASSNATAQGIHEYHLNRGWSGAGYNYYITKDGRVQELRGKNQGAHVKGHNDYTLGVSFQGNFDLTGEHPTNLQYVVGGQFVASLVKEYGLSIDDVIGHRDLASTACPGKNFDMNTLKKYVNIHINKNDDVTGHWAEESIRKVFASGKMIGYPDGTFRPNAPITRAEIATLIARGDI